MVRQFSSSRVYLSSPVQTGPAEMFQVCRNRSGCESAAAEMLNTILHPSQQMRGCERQTTMSDTDLSSEYTPKVISNHICVLVIGCVAFGRKQETSYLSFYDSTLNVSVCVPD